MTAGQHGCTELVAAQAMAALQPVGTPVQAVAGVSAFNPVGLVFERWRGVEDYRFWQAFRDAKHGHSGTLEFVEAQFLKHATR